ncbi:MAG: autotransporter outer membrane beta-barrel domain-containing protein [Proteobacteria bacterium]|nr:autotransporter outer membrane beta-barrel domain-containing protein [Pseudomonadota bacterium]
MSVDKIKISSLWAIVLASASLPSYALVYPDVGSMLQALQPTAAVTAPELNDLIIALNALPTEQQRFDALQTLIPSADGSLRAASEGPMRQMESVLYDRLIRIKTASGVSSGDEVDTEKNKDKPKAKAKDGDVPDKISELIESTNGETVTTTDTAEIDKGVWAQLVGNNTGQDERYTVPGYDADVLGILVGRDHLFSPNFMVGLAGGFVHADVESRGPSGSFLDIKRYQLTMYAGLTFERPFFLNGSFTVAYNDYDNNRNILVPPVGGEPFVRIAWADFGAWETNAHVETGYRYECGHFHAIPKVMLTFSQFNINGYFERDAFGLDLYAKYQDMTFVPLGAGIKLEYQNEFEKAYVTPEIHAYAFHDFSHDAQTATALFTGGGFDFLSQGAEPASNSFEVGAGIAVHSYVNTTVIIQYDYAARSDYHRHAAFIKVRHEWA